MGAAVAKDVQDAIDELSPEVIVDAEYKHVKGTLDPGNPGWSVIGTSISGFKNVTIDVSVFIDVPVTLNVAVEPLGVGGSLAFSTNLKFEVGLSFKAVVTPRNATTPSPTNQSTGATSKVGSVLDIAGGGSVGSQVSVSGMNAEVAITYGSDLGKVTVSIELD